jgi:nitrogen-specific signal transduction histidine kinase
MNGATIAILVALMVQLALGVVVFQANRHRKSNQCFLFLSLAAAAWLGSLYVVFGAMEPAMAALGIREASAAAVLIFTALNLFRVSLRRNEETWSQILYRSRFWLIIAFGVVCLCQTSFFLRHARLNEPIGLVAPSPLYGPGIYIYVTCFAIAAVALIIASIGDLRKTTGGQHAELSFVMIGGILTAVFPALLTVLLQRFINPTRLLWFAPFRVVLFSLVVAYGISTRRMMDVNTLLRRLMSYALLAAYLLALYGIIWWLVTSALHGATDNSHTIAHVAAAIVVAFAMAPARGISQRLAERLLISSHQLDFRQTMSKAAGILSSVTTLRDLLQRFADTISDAVGTDQVSIFLHARDGFRPRYSTIESANGENEIVLPADGPIVEHLQIHREPAVLDELNRIRPTPLVTRLGRRLREVHAAVALGIFSREHLVGIMLLGPRRTGRIYGSVEQDALQVLCGQLAVAIDNAELFTEVQNAKIYNETLLQNLTTGVIAAGTDKNVTVFNNEAGQITELVAAKVLDHSIESLPESVRDALNDTLRTGQSQEDREMVLRSGDRSTVVRASTSIFHGEDRQVLGALMVLTDITDLKRLELQIRRSDRLASLGTLSAGMAHEIKNPLVSIKTFAQLLPERYQDSDFRETFSNLIGHEIDRIDSLVNQLLRFARPAKPQLQSLHVHDVLEKSLLLVGHRLYQKDIKLTRSWKANVDTIRADPDQLEQVFLNFFINAMDAMKNGGELHVSTEIGSDEAWVQALTQASGYRHEVLRISIRDSGEGIRSEDLTHVFDPFFTTKDYGTGLGLSVVHGIIQEHGGQIEVESELKKGTAFHILLPLVRSDREVVAA